MLSSFAEQSYPQSHHLTTVAAGCSISDSILKAGIHQIIREQTKNRQPIEDFNAPTVLNPTGLSDEIVCSTEGFSAEIKGPTGLSPVNNVGFTASLSLSLSLSLSCSAGAAVLSGGQSMMKAE
ncbi:hypothetical protein L1887_23343 [Cichorium endivia]|nr:hypothetical protein L1887_23343 [Cichorium endivia]